MKPNNHPHEQAPHETVQRLRVSRLFSGQEFYSDQIVEIGNGKILSLTPARNHPAAADLPILAGTLAPGFIDIQVNGGGGRLLNNSPNRETFSHVAQAHAGQGVVGLMATLITDRPDVYEAALQDLSPQPLPQGILGLHIEGPFLAPERRGTHRAAEVRRPGQNDSAWLESLCNATYPRMLTCAPEQVDLDQIKHWSAKGIRVCLGHSAASYDQGLAALTAGASGFTHVFNAMPALENRAPGLVGLAMDKNQAWASLIVDGHHVAAANVRLLTNIKPDRTILVSDAMATVGSPNKAFELYGKIIEEQDGKLINAEGRLAGTAIGLMDAVRVAHTWAEIPLAQCLRMASLLPAQFLGLNHRFGELSPGFAASMVLFDEDLHVQSTWIDGIQVYSTPGDLKTDEASERNFPNAL